MPDHKKLIKLNRHALDTLSEGKRTSRIGTTWKALDGTWGGKNTASEVEYFRSKAEAEAFATKKQPTAVRSGTEDFQLRNNAKSNMKRWQQKIDWLRERIDQETKHLKWAEAQMEKAKKLAAKGEWDWISMELYEPN